MNGENSLSEKLAHAAWQILNGDNNWEGDEEYNVSNKRELIKAIAAELKKAKPVAEESNRLRNALNEIHSWLVCGCIATPEDMAQSFAHMTEVSEYGLGLKGEKP